MSSLFGVLLGSLVRLVAAVSLGVSALYPCGRWYSSNYGCDVVQVHPFLLLLALASGFSFRICASEAYLSLRCLSCLNCGQALERSGLNLLYLETVGWSVSVKMFFLLLVGMRECRSRLWRDEGGREGIEATAMFLPPCSGPRGLSILPASLSKTIVILLMFNSANTSCRTIVCHPSRW